MNSLDRWLYVIERMLAFVGGATIFLLVLLTGVNVLGRWLFSLPVDGYVDWVEQAMAFIAFLGLAYTQRMDGHIRMDLVIRHFRPRVLWFAEIISTTLMLVISLMITYGASLHFWRAYQIGDSSLDIELPTWPAKLVIPFALTVLSLRLILQLIDFFCAWKNNRAPTLKASDFDAMTETKHVE